MWMFIRYHSNRKHRNRASLCGIIRKFKYALTEATQRGFFSSLKYFASAVLFCVRRQQQNSHRCVSKVMESEDKAKGSVECLTGGSYSPTFNLTTHTEKGTLSTELARNAAQRVEIFDSQEVPPPCRDILPRWLKRADQQSYWSHSGSSVWSAEDNEELKIQQKQKVEKNVGEKQECLSSDLLQSITVWQQGQPLQSEMNPSRLSVLQGEPLHRYSQVCS